MDNGVQDHTSTEHQGADVSMDTPEKLEKGKGKMASSDIPMHEDDTEDSEEDEEGDGEVGADVEADDADEDNMEEIDLDNIIGARTRGKNIDYAQAAKDYPEEEDDEDDEDDDDFEDPDAMSE